MRTIESCLATREQARWNALCDLSSSSRERFDEAMQTLRRVRQADRDHPIGPAAGMTADEIRAAVPIRDGIVQIADIPEPWARRFEVMSTGSTRTAAGYYAGDWDKFLRLWPGDAARIEALADGRQA